MLACIVEAMNFREKQAKEREEDYVPIHLPNCTLHLAHSLE